MRILVLENNLMWSSRLVNALKVLGHEPILVKSALSEWPVAEAAIVNLGVPEFVDAVRDLTSRGIAVTGHAGHKEKDLLELGRAAGCARLATNGELAHKLAELFPVPSP